MPKVDICTQLITVADMEHMRTQLEPLSLSERYHHDPLKHRNWVCFSGRADGHAACYTV